MTQNLMGKPIKVCESIFVESRNGNILTEESEIVKKWTEYCKEFYNYSINPDENILNDDRGTCVEEYLLADFNIRSGTCNTKCYIIFYYFLFILTVILKSFTSYNYLFHIILYLLH